MDNKNTNVEDGSKMDNNDNIANNDSILSSLRSTKIDDKVDKKFVIPSQKQTIEKEGKKARKKSCKEATDMNPSPISIKRVKMSPEEQIAAALNNISMVMN